LGAPTDGQEKVLISFRDGWDEPSSRTIWQAWLGSTATLWQFL